MGERSHRDRAFGTGASIAFAAGTLLLLLAGYLFVGLPEEPRQPNMNDQFMRGQVTIGDVSERSHEWMRRSEERQMQLFEAIAASMFGVFALAVGGSLFMRSSRRRREIAYADAEFTAEAVARGLKRGINSDS